MLPRWDHRHSHVSLGRAAFHHNGSTELKVGKVRKMLSFCPGSHSPHCKYRCFPPTNFLNSCDPIPCLSRPQNNLPHLHTYSTPPRKCPPSPGRPTQRACNVFYAKTPTHFFSAAITAANVAVLCVQTVQLRRSDTSTTQELFMPMAPSHDLNLTTVTEHVMSVLKKSR